jgi:hypothetical protein
MNEQQFTEAIDGMTTEEVEQHFEALMALALSIAPESQQDQEAQA